MTDCIFEGRTAVVTGGSRGIGRSVCEMLAERGARVAINYEANEQAARETLAAIDGGSENSMIVQADVSDEQQVGNIR